MSGMVYEMRKSEVEAGSEEDGVRADDGRVRYRVAEGNPGRTRTSGACV
jgi:hypothetical protein